MNIYLLEEQRIKKFNDCILITNYDFIRSAVLPYLKELIEDQMFLIYLDFPYEVSKVVINKNMYRQVITYTLPHDFECDPIFQEINTKYDGNYTIVISKTKQDAVDEWLNWKVMDLENLKN